MEPENIKYRHRICELTARDRGDFLAIILDRWPNTVIWPSIKRGNAFRELSLEEAALSEEKHLYLGLSEFDPVLRRQGERRTDSLQGSRNPFWVISIQISFIEERDLRTIFPLPMIKPADWKGSVFSGQQFLIGRFDTEVPAQKKFVDAVFRMSAKFMTNWVQEIDLLTGKTVAPAYGGNKWNGPDSFRLCETNDAFFLALRFDEETDRWTGYRPVEKPVK